MGNLDTKLVYETPLFVEKGTHFLNYLILKVYTGLDTLPPSRKHMLSTIRPTQNKIIQSQLKGICYNCDKKYFL